MNDIDNEVEEIANPRDRSIQPGSEDREDHDQIKQCLHFLFGQSYYSV